MANVIIEELDNSSEESFGTPTSDRSVDEFHDPAIDVHEKPDAKAVDLVYGEPKRDKEPGKESIQGSKAPMENGARGEASCGIPQKIEADDKQRTDSGSSQPPSTSTPDSEGKCIAEALPNNEEVLQEADRLKGEANKLYGDARYSEALDVYKEAMDTLPEGAAQQRAVLFANMAATRLKLEQHAEAAKDCSACLALEPPTPLEIKALSRRSLAYEKLDDLDRALADYEKLVSLDGSNSSYRASVRRLKPIVQERQEKMKEEMIGKLKDLGNSVLGKFGMSLDNFKAEKDPNTGSYSINFKQ